MIIGICILFLAIIFIVFSAKNPAADCLYFDAENVIGEAMQARQAESLSDCETDIVSLKADEVVADNPAAPAVPMPVFEEDVPVSPAITVRVNNTPPPPSTAPTVQDTLDAVRSATKQFDPNKKAENIYKKVASKL